MILDILAVLAVLLPFALITAAWADEYGWDEVGKVAAGILLWATIGTGAVWGIVRVVGWFA